MACLRIQPVSQTAQLELHYVIMTWSYITYHDMEGGGTVNCTAGEMLVGRKRVLFADEVRRLCLSNAALLYCVLLNSLTWPPGSECSVPALPRSS